MRKAVAKRTDFGNFEQFPGGKAFLSPDIALKRAVFECECGLWYRDLILTPAVLERLSEGGSIVERWTNEERPAFDRVTTVLDAHFPAGGKILDVGAHTGALLARVGPAWERFALEPMRSSSEGIHGATVIRAYLEDAVLKAGSFDAITMLDILEHLSAPAAAIAEVARALRPGGLLIAETGDSSCWSAKLLRGGWYYLSYLEHSQVFNREALQRLLEANGMSLLSIQNVSHGTIPAAVKLKRWLQAALFGLVTLFGRAPYVWRQLNRLLRPGKPGNVPSTLDIGRDHIFFVARKNADDAGLDDSTDADARQGI